ncbi:sugar ABC transporter permease [Caldilinea sp.]|uniref:carbohydrate ABC transporter permease n=1 Tax=Caldilinea sp. TaxID=2293560 RepID=UPI002C3CE3D9|nr:sugar ABC transporter permease [Caldilinea sp.]
MTKWRRQAAPYLFISPFFIGYAIFFLYPVLWAFYLSFFQQVGIGSEPKFIGLGNYLNLFEDETFLKALFNTSYYALGSIFVIVPVALLLALVLFRRTLPGREFFRLFFFSPNITAGVVVGIIFTLVFGAEYGLINNYLLKPLGLPAVRWLQDPAWIMPSIIIVGLWRYTGINALYFMAGLQTISMEVREAATIDGANRWQVFRFVTLPLLRPTLVFVLTFAIIGSYNLFAEPSILVGAQGGTNNAGLFMTMYLYLTGFRFLKFGYAASIGYALAVVILLLTLLQGRLLGIFQED